MFDANPHSNWRGSGQKGGWRLFSGARRQIYHDPLCMSLCQGVVCLNHVDGALADTSCNGRFCWQFLRWIAGDTKVTPKTLLSKPLVRKICHLYNLKPHDPLLYNARRTSYPHIPHSSRWMVALSICDWGIKIGSDSDLIKHWQIKRCLAYSGIHSLTIYPRRYDTQMHPARSC